MWWRVILISCLSFCANAQTKIAIIYETKTCIVRSIILPDDDKALGTIHVANVDEVMIIADKIVSNNEIVVDLDKLRLQCLK